jgi:hypothetical protein
MRRGNHAGGRGGRGKNLPNWLVCQSGTLWFLPYDAVL